jgi:hypothetical protein
MGGRFDALKRFGGLFIVGDGRLRAPPEPCRSQFEALEVDLLYIYVSVCPAKHV